MRTDLIPPEIDQALKAWYLGKATREQLEMGAHQLPLILQHVQPGDMSEGLFMQFQQAASGMRMDLIRLEAKERLQSEGLE